MNLHFECVIDEIMIKSQFEFISIRIALFQFKHRILRQQLISENRAIDIT